MANTSQIKMQKPKLEVINLDSNRELGNSWGIARELAENKVIENTTPEGLFEMVKQVDDYKDKALIIVAYFTAGRIEEIVQFQKVKCGKKRVIVVKNGKSKKRWVQDWSNFEKIGDPIAGLTKKDVKEEIINNIPCVVFDIRNLKNRKDKRKEVPVKLDFEVNLKLWKVFKIYFDTVQHKHQELFPFGKRNAERVIKKIGWNPHSLRSLRLTHLVKYENYNEERLKLYAGWSDSRPSKHYIKLTYRDLV